MIELVRMVADHLKDPDLGVEAMLATLTKDRDSDVIPLVVPFIGNEADDLCVADEQDPPATPALYITEGFAPLALEGEVHTNDHRDSLPGSGLSVVIGFVEANANTIQSVQARTYILRAVLKSLRRMLDNAGAAGVFRNDQELVSCDRITVGRMSMTLQQARIAAAMECLFVTRDNNP